MSKDVKVLTAKRVPSYELARRGWCQLLGRLGFVGGRENNLRSLNETHVKASAPLGMHQCLSRTCSTVPCESVRAAWSRNSEVPELWAGQVA